MENRNTIRNFSQIMIRINSNLSDVEALRVNKFLRDVESGEGFWDGIKLSDLNSEENIYFDFSGVKFARPYGMLCLAQSIREFRDRHSSKIASKSTNISDKLEKVSKSRTTELRNACGYMGLVGFFADAGFDYESKIAGTIPESTKYIPITKISFHKFYESYEDAHELLEQEAEKLATLLAPDEQASEYRKVLQYVIFEALRNAMEHSDADCVRICGQRWDSGRNESRAEIAILDDGIGVLESLNRGALCRGLNSESDALKKAVEPGVSRNPISKKSDGPMANSGYGLYMIKKICEESGSFLLVSNGATLEMSKGKDDVEGYSEITGTSLKIEIDLNEFLKLGGLHKNLKRYRDESKSHVKPSSSSMASNIK